MAKTSAFAAAVKRAAGFGFWLFEWGPPGKIHNLKVEENNEERPRRRLALALLASLAVQLQWPWLASPVLVTPQIARNNAGFS